MIKLPFFYAVIMGLMGLVLTSSFEQKGTIEYWRIATIESTEADEPLILKTYKDTTSGNPIFERKTKDNTPLHYFKNVTGEVCFNAICRLLDIDVYWNITGRYLGFELPKGEFLSKYDHEPFTDMDYQQLHSLLGDESLPLDRVSFGELLESPQSMQEGVDGYSGATSKTVSTMVVKGAAYTTFKLWNTVNGPTMDLVSALTEKQLTPNLICRILHSQDITDKLWALDRMDVVMELTPQLEAKLLEMIFSDDFYLSYSATNAINVNHLRSAEFQNRLFSIYKKAKHSIKNRIVKKLMEAPFLSSEILHSSRALLPQFNGQQLKDFLQLYTKHDINDLKTCTEVAKVLKNKNKYISKIAYNFLIDLQVDDDIIELLEAYKKEKL